MREVREGRGIRTLRIGYSDKIQMRDAPTHQKEAPGMYSQVKQLADIESLRADGSWAHTLIYGLCAVTGPPRCPPTGLFQRAGAGLHVQSPAEIRCRIFSVFGMRPRVRSEVRCGEQPSIIRLSRDSAAKRLSSLLDGDNGSQARARISAHTLRTDAGLVERSGEEECPALSRNSRS